MKIIKEYKIFSIIGLVILGFLFYWFQVKPEQERKEFLSNNIKCQQEGSELAGKERADFLKENSKNESRDFGDIEFVFVKELNTCLYKNSTTVANETGYYNYKFIKDVYTNNVLVEYNNVTFSGQEPLYTNKEKYETLENKYFNN